MIYLERKQINDLGHDEYIEMYKGVFGKWDEQGNCPAEVYSVFYCVPRETILDQKYIGFMAGYATAPGVWYLQRGGFVKDEQRKAGNLKIYREALNELHNYWPCIRTHVANDDLSALKMDINAGFKIVGIRYTDRVEVEMIRFREEGNG